ncbi:MAG: hypothetical protein ACLGI5_10885 [Thermoleophilia bacterium]
MSAPSRLTPESVTAWSAALREPLRLLVIAIACVFAVWMLISHGNPAGLMPLLWWALR